MRLRERLSRAADSLDAALPERIMTRTGGDCRPDTGDCDMPDTIDWPHAIAVAVARSKKEVEEDVASGRVPRDVASFSELHDYVDANEYGGLCDTVPWITSAGRARLSEDGTDAANQVQNEVDAWIKAGGVRAGA
jgi:hypothetical protein